MVPELYLSPLSLAIATRQRIAERSRKSRKNARTGRYLTPSQPDVQPPSSIIVLCVKHRAGADDEKESPWASGKLATLPPSRLSLRSTPLHAPPPDWH